MLKKPISLAFRFFSFYIIALASAAFLSCSNADSELATADDTPTLRYTANSLYDSTVWTEEVELDRLTARVSAVEGISPRLNLSPLIVSASIPSEDSKIFPHLGSFGSLDTTLISKSLREMLTSFSDSIAKFKDADSFFVKENLYSLALFYTDFKDIFKDCFDFSPIEPESDANDDSKKTGNTESEGAENPAETAPKKLERIYFSSFVFGQPFLDGIYYEVPVKFASEKANLTVMVYCFENAGSWKIDQIQICDWEILNGKK